MCQNNMDVNYCIDLFQHLSKCSREKAFSNLVDSLKSEEMGTLLFLIEHQIDGENKTEEIEADKGDENEDKNCATKLMKPKRKRNDESVKLFEDEQGAYDNQKSRR